jgi:hypothetical protein
MCFPERLEDTHFLSKNILPVLKTKTPTLKSHLKLSINRQLFCSMQMYFRNLFEKDKR